MIDFETCRAILNEDGDNYTDDQVKEISAFLLSMAELSANKFCETLNLQEDETGNINGKS